MKDTLQDDLSVNYLIQKIGNHLIFTDARIMSLQLEVFYSIPTLEDAAKWMSDTVAIGKTNSKLI